MKNQISSQEYQKLMPDTQILIHRIYDGILIPTSIHIVNPPLDPEDVSQQTVCNILLRNALFKYNPSQSEPSTYFGKILKNTYVDMIRTERNPNPDRITEKPSYKSQDADYDNLEKALLSISPEQSQAIILSVIHEIKLKDIGISLELSVSVIKSRKSRGIKTLRNFL